MPTRCPRCAKDPDELLDDGTLYCEPCRLVYPAEQTPRLIEPAERERRDLA